MRIYTVKNKKLYRVRSPPQSLLFFIIVFFFYFLTIYCARIIYTPVRNTRAYLMRLRNCDARTTRRFLPDPLARARDDVPVGYTIATYVLKYHVITIIIGRDVTLYLHPVRVDVFLRQK